MSSAQKQQETMEHIFLSVKSILIMLKDFQGEIKANFVDVKKSVKKLWENNLDDPMAIEVILDTIRATPIDEHEELLKHSKRLVKQIRYRKERVDDHDYTKDVLEAWTNSLIKTLWKVSAKEYKILTDSIQKAFRLLENVKSMITDEELEKEKDNKDKKPGFKQGKGLGDY